MERKHVEGIALAVMASKGVGRVEETVGEVRRGGVCAVCC